MLTPLHATTVHPHPPPPPSFSLQNPPPTMRLVDLGQADLARGVSFMEWNVRLLLPPMFLNFLELFEVMSLVLHCSDGSDLMKKESADRRRHKYVFLHLVRSSRIFTNVCIDRRLKQNTGTVIVPQVLPPAPHIQMGPLGCENPHGLGDCGGAKATGTANRPRSLLQLGSKQWLFDLCH
jgi:hypothetical protein